tara:strand:- start:1016 stop:1363 length:348 start_codon:yes stop_codon:yes gene_type:complete
MTKTEEQYEADFKYIEERFKDANFTISIDKDILKDKLTDKKEIVIKQYFFCACYGCGDINNRPPNKYFIIRNDNMTYENIIDELIKQNMKAECDHRFLESFDKETEMQYGMFLGS